MPGEQIIHEIADDGIGFVSEFSHDTADQHAGPAVPFQIDHAMRFARAMDFSPTMRTTGALMFGRDKLELFLELRIAHDLVPQRSTAGGDDLDYRLHSLDRGWFWEHELRCPPGNGTSRKHLQILFERGETRLAMCRQS